GVLARDLEEGALPEVAHEAHRVRLVRHHDALAAAAHRVVEGGAADPLDALAGRDVLLRGDLVGRALLQVPAGPDVRALGVLAKDHEVDVPGPEALQRAEA